MCPQLDVAEAGSYGESPVVGDLSKTNRNTSAPTTLWGGLCCVLTGVACLSLHRYTSSLPRAARLDQLHATADGIFRRFSLLSCRRSLIPSYEQLTICLGGAVLP